MIESKDEINPTPLSPLQVHYLKKELISRQIKSEIQLLSQYGALKNLGPPFANKDCVETDTPFLRFIFSRFVLTFPFLQKADSTFWSKLSEFLNEFAKKNISTTSTRDERTKRKKLGEKIVNELTLLLNAGIKTTAGKDESIKVDFTSAYENRNRKLLNDLSCTINGWNINIVSVRTVLEKHRIREHAHSEYIIQVKRQTFNEIIFVARRYKDFKNLYSKLKSEFASMDIPQLPTKVKEQTSSTFNKSQSVSDDPSSNGQYRHEKNRQNLRAYLRSLLSIREISRSRILFVFLTDSSLTLNEYEKRDIAERRELDSIRDEQLRKFNEEAENRAKELEHHVSEFKQEVMNSDGLSKVIYTIQETPNAFNLPITYQKIIEWGEIGFASTLYSLFIGSDNSSETFAQLKRTHSIMPYKTIRAVMKISNPVALLRGILDLFLAQPFGQKSLAQRILSMSVTEDLKELGKDIKTIEDEINDDGVCEKLRNFVYSPSELQTEIMRETKEEHINALIFAILHTKLLTPDLKTIQVARFTGSINNMKIDNTELLDNLKKLFFFYVRQRDKKMMIELLFQGITGDLLKDIITIFYEPLAKVYKAANISDTLSDLSEFLDDLINVVEEADRRGVVMYSSAESVVQTFVSLVHRHIPKFYSFVHSVYSHDSTGLFNSFLKWIESIFNFIRDGLTEQIDVQQLIDTVLTTEERTLLSTELDNLMSWHTWRKKRQLMRLKIEMDKHEDDDDSQSSVSSSNSMMDINHKREFPELKVMPKLLSPFVKLISSSMRQINIEQC
ncbi:3792_t:CDS:10 [Funneliformis caledonium]|uniref:3792_t:CDS:1 n=1 Tax=Funneliformis caledonium TaxID=1117310 RepID=A0A9N8VHC4_9GLOM|nr:3792_t:CDS:10 [Funneliformis caledonium]